MIIRIPFALPTLNETIAMSGSLVHHRSGKRFTSYNKSKQQVQEDLITLMRPLHAENPIPYPVDLSCRWIRENRRADPDNIAAGKKYILDALQATDILTGDGWSQIAGFDDSFEIGKPGVVVEMRRPRKQIIDDVLKLVFSSGMYAERVRNADPTFEVLEKVESDLQEAQNLLVDTVRGDMSRFDYMEELITSEWRS